MSKSPTTFRAEPVDPVDTDWDHVASLHRVNDGGGLLGGFKAIRTGTLAELVRHVASLPESERVRYCIVKEGARRLEVGDVMALARRPDIPERT